VNPHPLAGRRRFLTLLSVPALAPLLGLRIADAADDATVITLTQTSCQFVESENGLDHGFDAATKAACEAINERTADERLAAVQPLRLAPGRYVFRVTNRDVDYTLGFWLRGDGLIARTRLPSVSGGGLERGLTRDYEIELAPGHYVYSCPLNPTPDYPLVVEG